MKILRIFISYSLNEPINWMMVNEDGSIIESGTSSWKELVTIKNVNVEVYLGINCCSIFRVDLTKIANKKLTEELVLGMIEDQLVDDIDSSRAILLREENIVYVAVFNREYYDDLLQNLSELNKTILFIQPIAYTTVYEEGYLTVFLDKEQSFIRKSQYEYFVLDDNSPLPILLEDVLLDSNPSKIYLYTNNPENAKLIKSKFGIECQLMRNDSLAFGKVVWNFYNQKNNKFTFRFTADVRNSIDGLLKFLKWFGLIALTIWVMIIIFLMINNINSRIQIKNDLKKIIPTEANNKNLIPLAQEKIMQMYHVRGMYASTDSVPMFQAFLEVVSDIGTNSIVQIKYTNSKLVVFLNDSFNQSQFVSYENIFKVKQLVAVLTDYKSYSKANRNESNNAVDNVANVDGEAEDKQIRINEENTKWVVTLMPINTEE